MAGRATRFGNGGGHLYRSPLAICLAAVLLAAAACGDDSSDDNGDANPATTAAPTTTTTQPPATDTEEALAAVQDLADEASYLEEQLYKDPTAVDQPDNDYVLQFREVFTEDALAPDSVFDHLQDFTDHDERMLPGPSGIFSEYYLHSPEPDGEDVLLFSFCVAEDREAHSPDGPVGDHAAFTRIRRGDGEAQRVDGKWHLDHLTRRGHLSERDPDLLQPGACEAEVEMPNIEDLDLEEVEDG